MTGKRRLIVTLFIGEDLNAEIALLVREQRQLEIVHRAGCQRMGDGLHAVDIQLIIENLNVQHRAKQRFVACGTPAVAYDLLGVVALMAAHFFQLVSQSQRQRGQGLLRVDIDRQRQHVQHRPGRGERRGAHAAHKDKPGGVVQPSGEAAQPQRHQRKRQIGALRLPGRLCKLAKGAAVHCNFQAQNVGSGGASRQRRGRERDRRRKLLALLCPEGTVARVCLAVAIALILVHHLGKGCKRGCRRRFTLFPGGIHRGDLAGNGREAEAIHHQMVIALIPVPAAFPHLNQLVKRQRLPAVDAQVLVKIGLHQRHGVVVRGSANDGRLRQNEGVIHPLPHLAVILGKTHPQGIGLHHAFSNRFCQQWRVNVAFQFGVVRHAPGVWQGGKLLRHPDTRLGGNERKTVHALPSAKWDGISVCQCPASHCWHASWDCGSQTTRQPAGSSHCCGHRLYCPWSFCRMANCPCGLSKGLLNSIQTPLVNKRLPEGHQPLRQPTAPAKRIVPAVNLTPENRLLRV